MERHVKVKFIRGAALFKLLTIGFSISGVLFFVAQGLGSCFGGRGYKINATYVTGIKGLLWSPLVGLGCGLLFAMCAWVFVYVGLRVFSWVRPITIAYEDLTPVPIDPPWPTPPEPPPVIRENSIAP